MNKIIHNIGIGAAALVIGTLIYAATENIITEIRTQDALDNHIASNKLAVVQFYSPTCPVCNAFKKKRIFSQAAHQLPNINFAQVSSEEGKAIHHAQKIQHYPTFVYFKNGAPVKRTEGYVDNPVFTQNVKKILSE